MLEIPAILLTCVALFGYVNHRYLKLPLTVGLVVMALISALLSLVFDHFLPQIGISDKLQIWLKNIDFNKTLMEGMLSFLLFAGALHVNLKNLLEARLHVFSLASAGVLISTLVNGGGFYFLTQIFGIDIDFTICLLFGVIVSPTDPVAVLALLKRIKIPTRMEATIAGESLFNDGVAVVLYSLLVAIAFGAAGGSGGELTGANAIVGFFAREAFGGALLGLVTGYGAFLLLRQMDDYVVEVITTLALVMGGYSLSYNLPYHIHVSGPLAMVISGLFIGNHGKMFAMSSATHHQLFAFWELIDEFLNALLFVLIGFQLLNITFNLNFIYSSILLIPTILLIRFTGIKLALFMFLKRMSYNLQIKAHPM